MTPARTLSVLLASVAALFPVAAEASRRAAEPAEAQNPLTAYVRARAADDLGELDLAAKGYAAALAENPGNTTLALRAFRQAMEAGDMRLAVRTARMLDANASLPPDGTVLLLADAVSRHAWGETSPLIARMTREKLFAFFAPVMQAWIAKASGKGDPLAPLTAVPPGGLAASYADEHRVLLLIATGQTKEGLSALASLQLPDAAREERVRIAVAATLAARRETDAALGVLTGEGAATLSARAAIAARRTLPGAITDADAGIAELMVRVAAEVNKQQAAALALGFARMGTMLAPADSEGWLLVAGLLTGGGAWDAALAALDHVPADDPFAGTARDARLIILSNSGRADAALAQAEVAARRPGASTQDWARYGDLLMAAKRQADAAAAYAQALAVAGGDKAPPAVAWPLLLQQAAAKLQAGDWPAARASAERALTLAPDRPDLLNFLGYSMLERGEEVPAASAMIAKAAAQAPDDPAIMDSLGWSWYVRGDLGRAIPLIERAARGAPAEPDINEHLGDVYWQAGRRLDARYAWRAALVAANGDQATRLRAKIDYGETGKP
jgi:tetratricopeptide (TPR) repeat protein